MQRILTPDLQRDLDGGRELLSELRGALARFGATEPDISALDSSIRQLDELFLLVVVGEFNAGKSAFINAIAGQPILREGVTPTTARIHVLKHGDSTLQDTESGGVVVSTAPVELLRDVHIVDTPGTNAIIREHEQLTTHFVPRADLVLFVTSADRPFTETERAFFELIRGWGKKIVIVINKVDILERSGELEEVVEFVRSSAQRLFGITPEIFPVSARLALRAKQGEPALWSASRFEPGVMGLSSGRDGSALYRQAARAFFHRYSLPHPDPSPATQGRGPEIPLPCPRFFADGGEWGWGSARATAYRAARDAFRRGRRRGRSGRGQY